jgi:hypothetical protein
MGGKMINLIDEYKNELCDGTYLVVLPISRLVIENEYNVGKFRFFPSKEVDIESLRTVRNKSIDDLNSNLIELSGQDLREVSTSVTGISLEDYKSNTLVAYTTSINWDEFLEADHSYDIKLIRKLSHEVEKVMNIIKFYFCRADLVETLPGHVGTWDGSSTYSTLLLYNIEDHESYVIAGSVITHSVVKGLGLEQIIIQ